MQITRDRIRLQLANAQAEPQDVLSSATPFFFVGNDVQFECALFTDQGTFQNLANIGNLASVELDIKPSASRLQLPVMSQTLSSGSFNASMTLAQWQTGDPLQWQFLFTFANGLTSVFNGGNVGTFWFTIYAWTNDSTPQKVTLGAGSINLINDGSNVAAPAYVAAPQYLTLAQANALFGGTNLGTKVSKTGDTMTGDLIFSGQIGGVVMANVTTAQRGPLITSVGAILLDTTANTPFYFGNAGQWKQLVASVNGLSGFVSLTADNIPTGITNLYLTQPGVVNTLLTGYVPGSGVVASTDTVLQALQKLAGGTGSVSSVGMTVPGALLTVTGAPITSSGTLALGLTLQPANYVLCGPLTGANAAPFFRQLISTDIPAITQAQVAGLATTLAGYLALTGGTLTGALTLPSATPLGFQAASRSYNDSAYLAITGGTLLGSLSTQNLTVQATYSASWSGTPTVGTHLCNKFYVDGKASLTGAVFTGGVGFSGTGNAGITLSNLTQTQINALMPAAGMTVYNTSLSAVQYYNGSWQSLGSSGTSWFSGSGAPSSGIGSNGSYYLDTATGNIYMKSSGSWSLIYSLAGTGALPLAGGTMTGQITFSNGIGVIVGWGYGWTTACTSTILSFTSPSASATVSILPSVTTPPHYDLGVNNGGLFCSDALTIAGNQVVASRQASIANPDGTLSGGTATINSILTALRNHGLIST